MTKEEILKYAKVKNAPKGYVHRFKNDEPLTIDDLRWASKHHLDLGYKVYLRAVNECGLALDYVPNKYKTYEICMEAVKRDGLALGLVPDKYKTYEICMEAVKECSLALDYVPNKYKTYEICMEAVKKYGLTWELVPEKYRKRIEQELKLNPTRRVNSGRE